MAKGKPNYVVKLKPGETTLFPRLHAPSIHVVGTGRNTYLWTGGEDGGGCVGHRAGPATLRRLAKEILARVGHGNKGPRP